LSDESRCPPFHSHRCCDCRGPRINIAVFDPNLRTAYVQQYSFGSARSRTNMVVEAALGSQV
jgi:hypothetical protein